MELEPYVSSWTEDGTLRDLGFLLSLFFCFGVVSVASQRSNLEEEEEEFITSGNWSGKHNSLSRGAV
jgi:hypothetical protein